MGLTDCQKEMIRAVAENDIRKAKRCALASIAEDATQKNREFCIRYRNILTSEGSAMISMPSELQDILLCEDPALSFKENRYYVTKEQTDLAERILRMSVVSQKLMELQVPYKNATLLYGPPGTGKTMFARYIAYKKACRSAILISQKRWTLIWEPPPGISQRHSPMQHRTHAYSFWMKWMRSAATGVRA